MVQRNTRRKPARRDSGAKGLFVLVGVVGYLIVHFIWWVLAALVLIAAGFTVRALIRGQLRRRNACDPYLPAMAGRADEQNDLLLGGDGRRIYGPQGV